MDQRPTNAAWSFQPSQAAGDSLGLSVAGGRGSPLGDVPVFIAMIQHRGAAAKTRRLKVRVRR